MNLIKFKDNIFIVSVIYNLILCFLMHNNHFIVNGVYYWMIAGFDVLLMLLITKKEKIGKSDLFKIILFCSLQCISYMYSAIIDLPIGFDFHRILVTISLYIIFFVVSQHIALSESKQDSVLVVVELYATICTAIDFIYNISQIKIVASNFEAVKYYGYYYYSFFTTRTESAYISFLAASISIFMITRKKGVIHYILYIVNLLHIVLTCARMPLIATLAITFIMLAIDKAFRKQLYVFFMVTLIIIFFNTHNFFEIFRNSALSFLDHSGTSGVDTGEVRVSAWKDLFNNSNLIQWLIGHGMGAQTVLTTYYSPNYTVQGYHSMYVDAFCQGGIIYIILLIHAIIYTTISLIKSKLDFNSKAFFASLIIAFCISQFTDSVGSLFDYMPFSLICSALIIGIPLARVKSTVKESN